ncbi:hypothetical protein EB796_019197 [Bugula neritina]|uniref:Uncharacterized protein n=1 Tax=Bugula neritina TaxID=10212 RepID=A0A7J7J8W8_BUGNE|nr:hypothetical protein EB796_019197 [Bugula neritina]
MIRSTKQLPCVATALYITLSCLDQKSGFPYLILTFSISNLIRFRLTSHPLVTAAPISDYCALFREFKPILNMRGILSS